MDLQLTERLQPALLDRLQDDSPENQHLEVIDRRYLNLAQLRAAVLRDLSWLLNASRPPDSDGIGAYPEAERSVINYGMPSLSGATVSSLNVAELSRTIRATIECFEPRIVPGSLVVEAMGEGKKLEGNQLSLRIEARLSAEPVPLELLFRTDLDLETGQVDLKEMS